MKNPNKTILFAPIHFFYTSNYGSELLWAQKIFNGVSKKIPSIGISYSVIKNEKIKKNIKFFTKNKAPYFYSLLENYRFIRYYTALSKKYIKNENIGVIHHILPFAIGKTFNPLFFSLRKIPKVIGPVQTLLDYDNKDLKNNKLFVEKNKGLLPKIIQLSLSGIFKSLSDATLKKADKIIVINKKTKQVLIHRGINSKKIEIIPPGIDTKLFKPLKRKDEIIELITVGYLMERKGVDLIIKAMSEIVKLKKNVRLRIVGDGPQKKNLEKQVKKLKLEKHVIFEGLVPHSKVAKLYRNADIFVSMSRSESWGQMYLEAMASGLPIITSKTIGSESIIKNDKFGYLIKQGDVGTLVKKIITLVNDKRKLERFSLVARQETVSIYDWEKSIIPKYVKIYKELLKQ